MEYSYIPTPGPAVHDGAVQFDAIHRSAPFEANRNRADSYLVGQGLPEQVEDVAEVRRT